MMPTKKVPGRTPKGAGVPIKKGANAKQNQSPKSKGAAPMANPVAKSGNSLPPGSAPPPDAATSAMLDRVLMRKGK